MAKFPIIDLHQDLMLHINNRSFFDGEWQTNFELLENSPIKILAATAFPLPADENFLDPVTNDLIEKDFGSYVEHCDNNPNWKIIKSSKDIKSIMESDDLRGLIMHIEGLNVFEDNDESWDRLERWYEMGWRSLGIVWNLTNPLGGGTKDDTQGLTPLGRKMIKWIRDKNIVTDFAHMNQQTFWDVSKIVGDLPLYISHGNSKHCCPSPRNYSDEQLKKVAQSGGVAGVFFPRQYVTPKEVGTIGDVVEQVNHMRDVMGIDHVALGSDFGGIISGFIEDLESVPKLELFWKALTEEGYSDSDLEKIAYKNSQRVLEAHLG